MKKLIGILNTFVLAFSAATVVVSCNGQERKILEETSNKDIIKTNLMTFSNVASDIDEDSIMKEMEQINREIDKWLQEKIIIADGKKTFKNVKSIVEVNLSKLAFNKQVTLGIEFTDSIFSDDDIIYKVEDAFNIEIDLVSNINNKTSFSGSYSAPSIIGLSKSEIKYPTIEKTIENVFAEEKFINHLSNLINIKADEKNTVKDLIDALRKLNSTDVFGKDEDINQYEFKYYTNADENDKLVADQIVSVVLKLYSDDESTLYLTTTFNLKIVESELHKYQRITEKIKSYVNDKEFDFSKNEELNADGKIKWTETLSKIVNPMKIADYLGFQTLGSEFNSEYADFIDFNLVVDAAKILDSNKGNTYITYSSDQDYVPLILKLSKKNSSDSIYEEKTVNLKIKVAGVTDEQIYKKQEDVKEKFEYIYADHSDGLPSLKAFLKSNRDFNSWKWENALKFLSNNPDVFWGFKDADVSLEEVKDYLDIRFEQELDNPSNSVKNETFLTVLLASIFTQFEVYPKGRENWKPIDSSNFGFSNFVQEEWDTSLFSEIIFDHFNENEILFLESNIRSGTDGQGNLVKVEALKNEIKVKMQKLLSQDLTLKELTKYITFDFKIRKEGEPESTVTPDNDLLGKGNYIMSLKFKKYNDSDSKYAQYDIFNIAIE